MSSGIHMGLNLNIPGIALEANLTVGLGEPLPTDPSVVALRSARAHEQILEIKPIDSAWIKEHRGENELWFNAEGPYKGLSIEEKDQLRISRGREIDDRHGVGRTESGDLTPGRKWFEAQRDEGQLWFHRKGPYDGLSHDEAWKLMSQRQEEINREFGMVVPGA